MPSLEHGGRIAAFFVHFDFEKPAGEYGGAKTRIHRVDWRAPFTFNSFRFTHNRGGKEWMSMGQTPRGESLAKLKQAKENDRKRNEPETGDKKLDGPNRPST